MYPSTFSSADTSSPTHHATEYGDSAFSPLSMFPSMNTARKIAYDENLIGPFSMCYATIAGIELCQQQQ
jgi:hypothetical protein